MALSVIQACRSLALSTWLLSFCFVHLLCLDFTVAEKEEWYTAFVNITYVDPVTAEVRTEKTECGRYGEHSLKREARGVLAMPAAPQDRHACDPNSRFTPRGYGAWIALISRGNCTYRDKIRNAVGKNASAVVIFNVGSSNPNETITMSDPEFAFVQLCLCVLSHLDVMSDALDVMLAFRFNWNGHFSVLLVILRLKCFASEVEGEKRLLITFCSLIGQRRLGDAAKKAISQLQVRTIRKGDQETESDFDNCAVCIEGYKANDVVRILPCRHLFHKGCVDPWLVDHRTCPMCKMNILKALGLTSSAECLNELPLDYELAVGGVALNAMVMSDDVMAGDVVGGRDPGVRMVGLPQVLLDSEPLSQDTLPTEQSELQPIASGSSEMSLATGAGHSDIDTPTDDPKC
ncbi:RING finger protein 150-like [Sinocyclocheilus rhinocerous]|uniref:RING finger protein 150-like n=1 Tax=Sinocyclocheilus rhinocerous TaxID=307959 RepID=UPI0007B808C7|nr:PREDICTED: RING finger protein 150-like [Sinocyclocheilus rhinocerous]